MSNHNVFVTEEIFDVEGNKSQRITQVSYTQDEETGAWGWICPVDRLSIEAQAEWLRVMNVLSNVNGEDLRHVICGAGLMDHCLESVDISNYNEG